MSEKAWTDLIPPFAINTFGTTGILFSIMRYTNKFSNGLRGLHRQQYGWGAFSVCWCNWYHCSQTYKPIFTKIGLQPSPSSPLGYSFCLFNSLCIRDRESGILICELIAFLCRIANSLKCHYVQRARSYCYRGTNLKRYPSFPICTMVNITHSKRV